MIACAHNSIGGAAGCLQCEGERRLIEQLRIEQQRQRLADMQAVIDRRTAAQLAEANITLGPSPCPECGKVDSPTLRHSHQTEPLHLDAEIVICAAVRDLDGTVFRCHRHYHGFDLVTKRYGVGQGFITSRNRYVDRREALQLQLAAGIESVAPCGYRPPELYSEDLY